MHEMQKKTKIKGLRAARPQATNSGLIEIRVARIGGWVGLASGQTLVKKGQS